VVAPRLAVIAGRGSLPGLLLTECLRTARPCLVVSFAGVEGMSLPAGVPAFAARFERLGDMFAALKAEDVGAVVFAGGMERPHLDPAACDADTLAILPELLPHLGKGDDATLRAIAAIFERRGFRVEAAHDLIADLVAGEGAFTRAVPTADDLADAQRARRIAEALGAVDAGQGAVVAQGICLGAETIQGTDAMLDFVAATGARFRPDPTAARGVLWKGPKPSQDLRMDMPAIGPETVHRAAAAGLAGIAVAAGGTLILDREATIRAADETGLFLVGLGKT
jgi:DUF1009 family protein